MSRATRIGSVVAGALALAALVTSCATVPAGRPPQAGPPPVRRVVERPAPPAAAPGEAVRGPGRLRLEQEPMIEVGLAWDLETAEFTPRTGIYVTYPDGTSEPAGEVIRVARAAGGATFDNATGRASPRSGRLERGDTLWVGNPRLPGGSRVQWNSKTWRGAFKVFLGPRGGLTVALRLPLESYLLGVVPGEIGGLTKDLVEAGRAQAIAARSYTLFYRGRRASEGFDIYGTVEDQVYGPAESERPLATECVEQTRGRVALYEGQPIRANYCSTCGGMSAEVWEAWPSAALPYLECRRDRAGADDFCSASPQYRWRERWAASEFLFFVERHGPALGLSLPPGGLGDLVDVRAEARSRSGRVWRLLVRTTKGDVAIPAYAIRGVLRRAGTPSAILRSNLFKIDVRRDRATGRALEVVASGAGAGHGVGLCQTGALGMARGGAKAEEILRHYYPRIELERLY